MRKLAQVHSIESARRLKELVPLIRTDIEAGERAGIEHFRKAGEKLIEAKGLAGHGGFSRWLDEHFHLTARMAQHYMKLADPKNETRFAFGSLRQSIRHTSQPRATLLKAPPGHFIRTDGQVKALCDLNHEDPADVAEPGDSDEVIRHRIFMYRADESKRHALENGFDKAAPSEITGDILRAAKRAAKAWADVVTNLTERKGVRP